jgi:hypothetical protein
VTWEQIAEGVWSAGKAAKSGWNVRSTAVRLSGRDLVVVSPTRGLGDAAHAELATLGEPTVLLAPNYFHHLGLAEWSERYPGAVAVASDIALPRVRKKTGLDIEPLDALRAKLPDGAAILEPEGTKAGEVWLRVPTERGLAWVVSDAFFHAPESPTGFIGWFLRLTKTVPGLCLGWTFLELGLRDRRQYRAWLDDRLETEPPALLIVAHGVTCNAPDLGERLKQLSQARLPAL